MCSWVDYYSYKMRQVTYVSYSSQKPSILLFKGNIHWLHVRSLRQTVCDYFLGPSLPYSMSVLVLWALMLKEVSSRLLRMKGLVFWASHTDPPYGLYLLHVEIVPVHSYAHDGQCHNFIPHKTGIINLNICTEFFQDTSKKIP